MDKNLNELLKWSIEAQTPTDASQVAAGAAPSSRGLNTEALQALFANQPSDADLMKSSMAAIVSNDPEIELETKLTAFDNFEQLIENLDNANLLSKLGLWTPLLEQLAHAEKQIRLMAAWCVGTAVQNNVSCQERLLAMGNLGLAKLVDLAVNTDEDKGVRRKAVYALSSAVRNYQPAMDSVVEELGKQGRNLGKVDAEDMDQVDGVILPLREEASKA